MCVCVRARVRTHISVIEIRTLWLELSDSKMPDNCGQVCFDDPPQMDIPARYVRALFGRHGCSQHAAHENERLPGVSLRWHPSDAWLDSRDT